MGIPAALLFGLFFVYPLLKGIGMSFTNWDGMGKAQFIGLDNFQKFFADKRAINDIKTTLLFALFSAVLLNLVGLAYALLMNKSFRLQGAVRVIIYLPAIISPLIMGYIWYFLLQPERGFLYRALVKMNPSWIMPNWMGDYSLTILILVLVNVWQYAGMTMIIYTAGLQTIPKEMDESALMDGAGPIRRLFSITLPLLMPSIRINVVTNIIGSLSVFDVIMALTDGGPGYSTESLSIYIMRMCYGARTGYSTAVAMILFMIILVPVLISLRLTRQEA